jgi:Fe-S-cluster-containing hydrogenase component 2/CRP-like cAMP-binding protein
MQKNPGVPTAFGLLHRSNLTPLTEDGVRFEIDMCIGCDRCMRACPLPLSSQVNIADLNLATISDEVAPHVARFTQECVMCGSCVPVCPVNNHRDLLMLSLKQRLGITWDGQVNLQQVLSYLPTGWDLPGVLARLREQPMFGDAQQVTNSHLENLLARSKLLTPGPGSTLIQEGTYGREIYFILDGRFEVSALGPGGEPLPMAILGRGEFVGERGMLTGQQRTATVTSLTSALVVEVPEQVMQRMMEMLPALHQYFEGLNNARAAASILGRISLFQGVAAPDMRWLADKLTFKTYDRGDTVFSANDQFQPAREAIHVVVEGFVKVARVHTEPNGASSERIIAYRQHGDYFVGGLDMIGDGKAVKATAINRVRVAEISQEAISTILTRYPEVRQRFWQRVQEYREAAEAAQSFMTSREMLRAHTPQVLAEAEAREGLRALVGGGVVEGTEVLVIDLDKCVQCDKCEEACERRHGHSRMNRKGMVIGNISIATACRQCQDPVCMLCSRAGIARLPSGEVYITETCIGCGICAERCPYDNISIIELANEIQQKSSWERVKSFLTNGTGSERGRKTLPMANQPVAAGPLEVSEGRNAVSEFRKKLAIKCDLCAGYNNQACVQACPTGAAFRAQPTQFFGTTDEILQQKAL